MRTLAEFSTGLTESVLLAVQPGLDLSFEKVAMTGGHDALVLYEAVGVMVGGPWTDALRKLAYLRLIIQPLQQNLNDAGGQYIQLADAPERRDQLVIWAVVSIEALSVVVKGFSGRIEDPDVSLYFFFFSASNLLARQQATHDAGFRFTDPFVTICLVFGANYAAQPGGQQIA